MPPQKDDVETGGPLPPVPKPGPRKKIQFEGEPDYEYECPDETCNDARCPEPSPKLKQSKPFRCWPCSLWSKERAVWTLMGCTSSCLVLTVRLLLDHEPLAYLLHSIIVFLDMVLIHIFTHNKWLSVSGELVTILFAILFHFTKETVWELLETTLIAVLCSLQIICSRSQVQSENEQLQDDLQMLRRRSVILLRRSTVGAAVPGSSTPVNPVTDEELQAFIRQTAPPGGDETIDTTDSSSHSFLQDWLESNGPKTKEQMKLCGERFFEHFLDGSAGVMYTSFLGLIISEFIRYGQQGSY